MNNFKNIVLCADDFGFYPEVSQGILHLVERERLSAVSCMVNGADFSLRAKDLVALKNKVQIGLHFNLTEGHFLSIPDRACFSLNGLLFKSHAYLIKPSQILKELNTQLDLFIHLMGMMPDFIDGHQHVHQFPIIRTIMLDLYKQRLRTEGTVIRSTYPTITLPQYRFKGVVLAAAGGKRLHTALKNLNIPHHAYFSGVYDFSPDANYRELFRQWLALVPSDTLIMCHPGLISTASDPIAPTRSIEYNYFLSDDFLNDCCDFHIQLATGPKSGDQETINRHCG